MNLKTFPALYAFCFALCAAMAPSTAQEAKPSDNLTPPFVAWAGHQEVEIRFRIDKMKAAGLTLKDVEDVKYMRFSGDRWTRKIGEATVDLKAIAELKFRPLQAPPFTVKLLDGREAVITPSAKKIDRYMVTGEYFREDVTHRLSSPMVEDPANATVMSGLVVLGDLPHSTDADRIHRSLGEPLSQFARIEFRGKEGLHAKELSRMRLAYIATLEAMRGSQGISRELFEKRFGPGKATDPDKPNGPRQYPLETGRLEVHWKEDGKIVDYIYALHGKDLPTAKAHEPEKLAKEARDLADADRAIVMEYFSRMRETLTLRERTWVRALLARSQSQLHWTDAERRRMLGDEK